VIYPRRLEATEVALLAGWHRVSLPTSTLSWLGETYLRAFYRYVQQSRLDALVIQQDETEEIVAAAVIAREPSRFLQRLLLHTPMALFILLRAPWIIAGLLHRKRTTTTAGLIGSALSSTDLLHAPEVIHFYTAPNRRGCGFGTTLLRQCEGLLRSLGESRYWLKTQDTTDNRALAFYLRNGLTRIGTIVVRRAQFAVLAKKIDS
jgi:ribosomal protein S18 acetylase RimI-like enzyme